MVLGMSGLRASGGRMFGCGVKLMRSRLLCG